MRRVYLAGDLVFRADAAAIFARLRAICAGLGLIGVAPLDGQVALAGLPPGEATIMAIVAADRDLMDRCDGGLFCLDPFRRSADMDPGTAVEIGYMFAKGKPLAGYTTDGRQYPDKVAAYLRAAWGTAPRARQSFSAGAASGASEDADGVMIHSEGMVQNGMTEGFIRLSGGRVHADPDFDTAFFPRGNGHQRTPALSGAVERLSASAARRIALAAHGLAETRPEVPVTRARVARVLGRLGMLQIDSVSVLARAHYLPLFSRLGAYPRVLVDQAAWGAPRTLFEYWAHEASLLPLALHPLLRWRMQRAERLEGLGAATASFVGERGDYVAAVLAAIAADGAMSAAELEGPRGPGGWWGWSDGKRALEYLFRAGKLTTATRRGNFERVYDLPERVLPAAVLSAPTPGPAAARRALLAIAARAQGIATAYDLREYFRLDPVEAAIGIAALVETGELITTEVEGWGQPAYLHREARRPRRVEACALVSPFDPLMWERARPERLFGFRYRLEIYTPAEKREHGYYVLPFLLGETLVARVDLKADRAQATLLVQAAHAEPDAPRHAAERLACELARMAAWLGLERTAVAPVGDLSQALADAVAALPAADLFGHGRGDTPK